MGYPGGRRPAVSLRFLLSFAGCALAFPVSAQSIDPSVLKSLQSQLGTPDLSSMVSGSSQTSAVPASPADAASSFSMPSGRMDTLEEQQLRRAEARRLLLEMHVPTEVERDYRRRLNEPALRQFGYDFFQSAPPPTGTRLGAIGDDYVLGVGDEMQISFRGATNRSQTVRVDRDGRIVVTGLRPVRASGRSLASVRGELEAETRRIMLATDVFVSVGEVRAISVFVGGEVERPGQFTLTSMSDVATAIAQAGGVRRSGSLRQVRIVRAGGGSISVDLYGLLGIGTPPSVRLRDGDRVIVPVIGPTVAVTGAVSRPGIYELKGPASVSSVVAFAGGAIRQRGGQVVISRIDRDGSESFLRAPSASASVMGGDAVQIVGGSPGGATGRVRLAGHADNVGARPLVTAGTIADLVGPQRDLRPDTYQLAAVLLRRDPSSGARVFDVVNLSRELRERPSASLQSEDALFLFSRADIDFLNSSAVRQVVLGQPNPLPQCRSLRRLASLVNDTEANRFNAVTRGGFVVVSETGAQLGTVGAALGQGSRRATDLAIAGQLSQEQKDAERKEEEGKEKDREEEDRSLCSMVFEEEPELLSVLIEHSVSVGGAVRRPGAFPVGNGASARDLSLVADGILVGARDLVLDVNRAVGTGSERIAVNSQNSLLSLTELSAGDDIRFNAMQPSFEGSGVLLSGEVMRPGLYSIRKGEKLSELLARSGGMTAYAYAYGTVFTRRSVKESQEEGYKRTARELNNSLLAIAARSNQASGDGLAGAAGLIKTLSQAEAPGRMVVEADPRVLEMRPDLDTILEPGDSIFVPKRPNFVLALGDVNNPGALQFVAGKPANSYLREAGGLLSTADDDRVFLVLPNGTAQPVRMGGWGGSGGGTPPPGTTIIVPKNIDPLYRLSVIRDVTTIIAQLATSVATVAVLATR